MKVQIQQENGKPAAVLCQMTMNEFGLSLAAHLLNNLPRQDAQAMLTVALLTPDKNWQEMPKPTVEQDGQEVTAKFNLMLDHLNVLRSFAPDVAKALLSRKA